MNLKMKNTLAGSLLCMLVLICGLCRAEGPKRHAPQGGDAARQSKINPCSLLTSADVAAVQSEPVQETKPGNQQGAGLMMPQCLYRTATAAKSVSLAVAAPSPTSPRAFWRKQFHPAQDSAKEDDHKRADEKSGRKAQPQEEESTRPRAIRGLGEEAYWVGGPIAGALYVLKGKTFLRISVGGIREEPVRIEKSKALARVALKRM